MKNKPKIALVRGKHLNKYEMQIFEPLVSKFDLTGFGSLTPFHENFDFPIIKLPSPMDIPDFPFKMPIINRLFIDAQYLFGLEGKLRGFDIVHTAETYYHYTKQCLDAKKKGYVKKVVATVLENIPFNNEGIWGRKEFKKIARKELDHIIALTQRTKETLILEGANSEKITVISHGIDTKVFSPNEKREVKKEKLNEINILFVGRLERYKGIYEILYAAKRLLMAKDLKDYHLVFTLIGSGSEKENILKLGKKLGIEEFVTHKEVSYNKIPLEYQKADIFIAPSKSAKYWQEQYNTALLEAQASGLPIITTLSGGISENVGDAAILVQPDDFYSLVKALKTFILNPKLRFEYSQKARKRALEVLDVEIVAKKLSSLYEKILI